MTEQDVEVRSPRPGDWHILEIRDEAGEPNMYKIPFRLSCGVTGFCSFDEKPNARQALMALCLEHNLEMAELRAKIADLESKLAGNTTSYVRPHPEWRHVSLPCGCQAGGVSTVGLIYETCPTHFGKGETIEELKSLWAKAVKTGDA